MIINRCYFGLAAWGFTGMFKGAIIMAVFYTITEFWLERKNATAPVLYSMKQK